MNNAARIFFALVIALVPAGLYAAHASQNTKHVAEGPPGSEFPCQLPCLR